ncbi:MAG: hypothetical protein HOK67_10860 [Deltaproteobacteria bacterium]|jgi:hypothetical protein|nr:hypothetical protein [Deltaproteobacteria bacterium]MBT6500394.1 hypothetical protein [Deltaproteobacteria bacterium]MBT6614473.1 hypothetical protein [Deltaproteobacteria bacterium]MBT7151260.1 hypothetical protein [Deltaproteobacteria bacterium]
MKPIVTGMGLTWQGQLEKLKNNADKFNYNHMVIVPNDRKQGEM